MDIRNHFATAGGASNAGQSSASPAAPKLYSFQEAGVEWLSAIINQGQAPLAGAAARPPGGILGDEM